MIFIIDADHHRGDFDIQICRISEFRAYGENPEAVAELVAEFSRGEWDVPSFPADLQAVVDAATQKAMDYHCRRPFYIAG